MKRVTYKKEFNNIEDALTKVPKSLKENNNVFELTDGNQTYKVRWEGTLTEGKAVALQAKDENLISEDMKHMKHLMGYTSEATLGTPKSGDRVSENKTFTKLLNNSKKKRLVEAALLEELLDEGVLEEGFVDNLRKGIITVAMIAGFLGSANAQNPKAVKLVQNAIEANVGPDKTEQLKTIIKQESGVTFTSDAVDTLFDFAAADKPFQGQDVPELYLGKYKDVGYAKLTGKNHTGDGGFEYTVDIKDKKYIDNVRNYVGANNKKLNNTTINFTLNGAPMASKTITLK